MGDYPDYSYKAMPVNMPEVAAGVYEPWFWNYSVTIAARGNNTQSFAVPNDGFLYCIDSIYISASAATNASYSFYLNSDVIAWQYFNGFANADFTTNPSLVGIHGDSYQCKITNHDSSSRTFYVAVVGTKYKKPAGYDRPPRGAFSFFPTCLADYAYTQFTDQSIFNPTSWEWDFCDGTPKSYLQNPIHYYGTPGTYYPYLKVSNAYGYDIFSKDPVRVLPGRLYSAFTEYDPNNIITYYPDYNQIYIKGTSIGTGAYGFVKDFGAGSINRLDVWTFFYRVSTSDYWSVVSLCNSISRYRTSSSGYFLNADFTSNGLALTLYNNATVVSSDVLPVSHGKTYIIYIVRPYSSPTATLYVYDKTPGLYPIGTLSISGIPATQTFRYLIMAAKDTTNSAGNYIVGTPYIYYEN